MTAIAAECADRDAFNPRYAPRIPVICKALPTGMESRTKTLRFGMAGITGCSFNPSFLAAND
jgi:hypothetical protein